MFTPQQKLWITLKYGKCFVDEVERIELIRRKPRTIFNQPAPFPIHESDSYSFDYDEDTGLFTFTIFYYSHNGICIDYSKLKSHTVKSTISLDSAPTAGIYNTILKFLHKQKLS